MFEVLFGFDRSELLALVALETRGAAKFERFEDQFTAVLGMPNSSGDGTSRERMWINQERATMVVLIEEADLVMINYMPAPAPNP